MDDIALVVGVLADALDVPVSTEIPPERPERLITVSLASDSSDTFIHRPTMALTVWGSTDQDAHGLAVSAYHALAEAAQTHELLSSAQLATMSRDEWTRDGQSRYLVEVDLVINT